MSLSSSLNAVRACAGRSIAWCIAGASSVMTGQTRCFRLETHSPHSLQQRIRWKCCHPLRGAAGVSLGRRQTDRHGHGSASRGQRACRSPSQNSSWTRLRQKCAGVPVSRSGLAVAFGMTPRRLALCLCPIARRPLACAASPAGTIPQGNSLVEVPSQRLLGKTIFWCSCGVRLCGGVVSAWPK